MSDVRVSIVIPVYNGENFLGEAIDSALAQTYRNVEVIVVNDGSTDGGATKRIAQAYGDRIVYIEKPNGRVASALNAGIRAMTGDIFCWLSHDDRHHPYKTARQVEDWVANGRKLEILFSNYRLIDAQGASITNVLLNHDELAQKPPYALLRGSIHGCTTFVPKGILDEIGSFDETLRYTQDYDFWRRAIARFPFRHMPEVLIDSRVHDAQDSKRGDQRHEVAALWAAAIADTGKAQRIALEGTETRFLRRMAQFLKQNGLEEPAAAADRQADAVPPSRLVSVVIPVFNRPLLTVGAITSVLRQTHQEFEILVVDDGSTEGAEQIAAVVAKAGSRARLLRQTNQGPAAARNLGMSEAQGDYIAFLDSDDLFLDRKLEVQVRFMEETGSMFCHTSYFRHWRGSMGLAYFASGAGNTFPDIIGSCGIATPTVMIRREVFDGGARFPTSFRSGEDVSLWLSIAAEHGVNGIDEGLSIVRTGPEATAYDPAKALVGVDNILAFVKADSRLAAYQGHVTRLAQLRSELSGGVSGN